MIRKMMNGSQLLAIIVTHHFSQHGVHFVTPEQFSQQLAYMRHPAGKVIEAHSHNLVEREIYYTQEVLFIRKGKLRVDFYDDAEQYLESCILESGDTILLASGGHGFEVLEEVEMIEVKQGPYVDSKDKTRFDGISSHEVVIRDVNGK
jgi:hypothetical protein